MLSLLWRQKQQMMTYYSAYERQQNSVNPQNFVFLLTGSARSRTVASKLCCKSSPFKMVITLQKVLISDEVDPKCVEVLKANGIEVVKNTKLTKDELLTEIPVSGQFVFSSSSLSHVSACPVGEMGNRPPHTGPHSLFYLFAYQCCLVLLLFV